MKASVDASRPRKRLILFRHAKSAWPLGVDDFDRPLSGRGRDAAPRMGTFLEDSRLLPDLALVSTARRAQETWELFCRAIKPKIPTRRQREIYEAGDSSILDVIQAVEPEVRTLLVLGHNPGLEDLAVLLMKDDGGNAGQRLREKFPTAAIAVLTFDVADWRDIRAGSGSLDSFTVPKELA